MTLRATLDGLVADFTDNLLLAIRAASMEELLGTRVSSRSPGRSKQLAGGGGVPVPFRGKRAKKSAGRLRRRSAAQLQKGVEKIVALLKKAKQPMRSEQIQGVLRLDRREFPRLVLLGLKTKVLKKQGEKRGTEYTAA